MLRQSQAYCSDVSCTNDMNELRQGDAGGMSTVYGLLFAWVLITFGMLAYQTARRSIGGSSKPERSHLNGSVTNFEKRFCSVLSFFAVGCIHKYFDGQGIV
ncbi:unnamed protein product [Dibothriocephalus latus]|uniref:Uncharacterized protein n=1 Tax=Dibothriocephalus latus TaxID=60516 RepID=A0A3P7R8K7_DIBLA|nr:unnamed protein product [Dibothriocephalus latus]